ncbi:MAG: HEAT repeat domain-containing protein [Aureliella sp.]
MARVLAPAGIACAVALALGGCATPWLGQKKDIAQLEQEKKEHVKDLWESPERPHTIREISRKFVTGTRIESVALITELPGTGGKVNASSQRERLLDLMRRKNVNNPNQWLDDPSTAMVAAQVIVPPASRKGDRLNVLVKLSTHAEGSNLQSGWLMRSELAEMSVLDGQVREGFGYAWAEGPLVTEQQISGSDKPEAATAAMVVGGATLTQSRNIGLAIDESYAHAVTMAAVVPAINNRFTVFDGIKQVGVAKPKKEDYIDLTVPPRYRDDPDHFANVVQSIGVAESADARKARLEKCRLELGEPVTARSAAWQLEAAGKEGVPILVDGLKSPDKEIRFYSAHALAYLNEPRAIPILHELARIEPAFRAMCLTGLSLIENFQASDALEDLLHSVDAETRYGALLALRDHDGASSSTVGNQIGKIGSILEIPSNSPPLVVVGLHKIPEVVIFGSNPTVHFTAFMYVNPRLMLRNTSAGRISVSHIVPGRDDRLAECDSDLRSILTAIAEVGGCYGDWVNFVRICGAEKYIDSEVAINPVPSGGRKYDRDGGKYPSGKDEPQGVVNDVPAEPPVNEDEAKKEESNWMNPLSWFSK